jgi:hypothetical protein
MWSTRTVWSLGLVLGLPLAPLTAWAGDPPIDSQATAPPSCDMNAKVVEFSSSSTRLSPEAKRVLDDAADWTKSSPDRTLRLRAAAEGTASTSASKLHQRRTTAVTTYLTRKGIDAARISASDLPAGPGAGDKAGSKSSVVEIETCQPAVAMTRPATPAPAAVASATTPAVGPSADRSIDESTAPVVPPDSAAVPPSSAPPPPVAAMPGESTDRTGSGAPALTTIPTPPVAMQTPPAQPAQQDYTRTAPQEPSDRPHSRVGVGTTIGGGVIGFVDDKARAFTEPGGSWETRVTAGTREWVALEAAYVGSAQTINALGLGNNARLIGNGAEGDLRVNLTRQMVQPYLFGGLGWDHYQLNMSGSNTSSLRDKDDVLTVPFGVGLSLRVARSVLFDLRGTARAAFYDDLMDGPYAASGQDAKLHSWNLAGRLGWEF